MSQDRQVRIRSPVRVTAPVKRATPGQPADQVKSDLMKEIELKQAKLALLQEQADGESTATEPPASQALTKAPAPFKSRDVRAHPGVRSSLPAATAPVNKFVHRPVTDSIVDNMSCRSGRHARRWHRSGLNVQHTWNRSSYWTIE